MQPGLRSAIARIDVVQQGRSISRGTGFLVADGLVLTALHVVADRTQPSLAPYPGEVVLSFPCGSAKASLDVEYWDRLADWALLRCEKPPGANGSLRPIPLAELRDDGAPWETYGFPDANPRDGMATLGEVSNHLGRLEGNPVIQLFSREAAAGQGAPVKGLSGAPVIVKNAVVGLLRFALMKDGQAVAGTVYACPVGAVMEKVAHLLPLPDPCFGLPGLPRRPLPPEPFRHLAWFTEKEAEVFFGRNRDIRVMYERLTAEDAPPILLLYGQPGVGKSSFLDAGLMPRLRWYHQVCYLRRDSRASMAETLRQALNLLGGEEAEAAGGLAAAWQAVERTDGKPLVVFFDQVEEVYTRPNGEFAGELDGFIREAGRLLSAGTVRGRLVLSFRKEWLSEIQKLVESNGLSCGKVFLEGLDRTGVVEAITGLTLTERLQRFYGLTIEAGTAEQIASDLLADRDSPIAPTLQILLTKMWSRAAARSRSAPVFTLEEYQGLRKEGVLLGDFLDQQLQTLEAAHGEWVESGLALDVLTYHTTPLGTSKECTLDDLLARYRHREADLPGLLQELERLFLLSDSSRDDGLKTTRLCHDTLAPLVRQRYARSEHPGQRARRIVESRVEDWVEGSSAALLSEGSLLAVEAGAAGMRLLTEAEQELVAASRVQQRARQRRRMALWLGAVAAVGAISIAAVVASLQRERAVGAEQLAQVQRKVAESQQSRAEKESVIADTQQSIAETRRRLAVQQQQIGALRLAISDGFRLAETEPAHALLSAIAAVARSRQMGRVDRQAEAILFQTVNEVRETNLFQAAEVAVPAIGWTADSGLALCAYDLHRSTSPFFGVWFYDAATGRLGAHPATISDGLARSTYGAGNSAYFQTSPDGNLAALAISNDGYLRVWNSSGQLLSDHLRAPGAPFIAFAAGQQGPLLLVLSDDSTVRAWNPITEKQLWEIQTDARKGGAAALAIAATRSAARNNEIVVLTGGPNGSIDLWGKDGKRIARYDAQIAAGVLKATDLVERDHVLLAAVQVSSDTVQLWSEARPGEAYYIWRFPGYTVSSVRFTPRGDMLAIAVSDGTVRFENPAGPEALPPMRGFGRMGYQSIAFQPSSERLAVIDGASRVHIGDAHNSLLLQRFQTMRTPLRQSESQLSFSPDGVWLASAVQQHVRFWNMRTGEMRDLPDVTSDQSWNARIAFSPDSRRIAVGGRDGSFRVSSLSGEIWKSFSVGPRQAVRALAFTRNGAALLLETQQGEQPPSAIHAVDFPSGHIAPLWPSGKGPPRIDDAAFSSDGTRVVTASNGDGGVTTIQVWDAEGAPAAPAFRLSGFAFGKEDGQGNAVRMLGFSPDGRVLVILKKEASSTRKDEYTGTYWSFDGRRVAPDSAATMGSGWPVLHPDGETLFRVGGPLEPDFFPGAGVRVFDRATGVPIAVLGTAPADFYGRIIYQLAISPDGKRLASLDDYGRVNVWRATWKEWLEAGCDRIRNHSILNTAGATDSFLLENIRYTKDVCRELVWSKEK